MIDEQELLDRIAPIKAVAKLPPIVASGKYTMVVPFVELVKIIKELAKEQNGKEGTERREDIRV